MKQFSRHIYKFFQRIDAKLTTPDKFLIEFKSKEWVGVVDRVLMGSLVDTIEIICKKWETYSIEDFEFLKDWVHKDIESHDPFIYALNDSLLLIEKQLSSRAQEAYDKPPTVEPARIKFESAETLRKELFLENKEISMLKVELTIKDVETLVRQSGRLGVDPLVSVLWQYIQNQEKQRIQSNVP